MQMNEAPFTIEASAAPPDSQGPHLWFDAVRRPEIARAIRSIYADIAAETEEHRPNCVASGRCCSFEKYGHRLYVTGLETAWFLVVRDAALTGHEIDDAEARGICPFLLDQRCSVHSIRPFGCRVFFCDPEARDWQNRLYERIHQRIIDLHRRFDLPYEYAEWRTMLRRCAVHQPRGMDHAASTPASESTGDIPSLLVQVRIQ